MTFAVHETNAVLFSAPVDTAKQIKCSFQMTGPFPRPAVPNINPCTGALDRGANSPQDFQHGPPGQGASPFQALLRRRGGLALLTGGRVSTGLLQPAAS